MTKIESEKELTYFLNKLLILYSAHLIAFFQSYL